MPLSIAPLALRIGCAIPRQTFHGTDLPEPLLGRLREAPAPAPIGRDIVLDAAHRRNLGTAADPDVVVDSHLGAQRHIVANRQAAREPDLGCEQTMPADDHLSLIHISEPTRQAEISYAVF